MRAAISRSKAAPADEADAALKVEERDELKKGEPEIVASAGSLSLSGFGTTLAQSEIGLCVGIIAQYNSRWHG